MLGSAECGVQQACPRDTGALPAMGLPGGFCILPGNAALGNDVVMLSISTRPHDLLPDPSVPLSASQLVESRKASQRGGKGIWKQRRQRGEKPAPQLIL